MSIKIFNIHTSRYENENVCAEKSLRLMYESFAGRAMTFAIFKRIFFSKICGMWADSPRSRKTVAKFIADNSIDIGEFKNSPSTYKTFNDFFTRELRESARPIAEESNPRAISFPSDGRHLLVRDISMSDSFYAKGRRFNMSEFLGDESLGRRFEHGDMLISRLSPLDYHRFHYPVSGEIVARKTINGALFSVSPIALIQRLSIFWENRRILNLIDSPEFGLCAFVEIGATNVGTIENFGKLGEVVGRGSQAGLFRFGGSCVVTIFPQSDRIEWNGKLAEMSLQNIECYAKVNSLAGILK